MPLLNSILKFCTDNQAKFISGIATGNEIWIIFYNPESKQKKFKIKQSTRKVMAVRHLLKLTSNFTCRLLDKRETIAGVFERGHKRDIENWQDNEMVWF